MIHYPYPESEDLEQLFPHTPIAERKLAFDSFMLRNVLDGNLIAIKYETKRQNQIVMFIKPQFGIAFYPTINIDELINIQNFARRMSNAKYN